METFDNEVEKAWKSLREKKGQNDKREVSVGKIQKKDERKSKSEEKKESKGEKEEKKEQKEETLEETLIESVSNMTSTGSTLEESENFFANRQSAVQAPARAERKDDKGKGYETQSDLYIKGGPKKEDVKYTPMSDQPMKEVIRPTIGNDNMFERNPLRIRAQMDEGLKREESTEMLHPGQFNPNYEKSESPMKVKEEKKYKFFR